MNYGEFLKKLREYCINRKMPNEILVNEPIEIIIETANIKKEKGPSKGKPFYYEITEASKIINNKLDLSPRVRDALRYEGMENRVIESFLSFFEDNIDKNLTSDLIDDFLATIQADPCFKPDELLQIVEYSHDPGLFLAMVLIKSIKEPNLKTNTENSIVWKNGDHYIKVIKGDILSLAMGKRSSKDRIVVIPVNTTFDTHISTQLEAEPYPRVSNKTLHGKLLQKIYSGGTTEESLRARVRDNLVKNGYLETIDDHIDLPIGSIATLSFGKATLYLLATSRFNERNTAYSTKEDIKSALSRFLEYYNEKGQGYDVYLPLIGTGLSRAGLGYQESLDLVLETLLDTSNKLHGKINIVIQPNVIDSIIIRKDS